MYRFREFPHFGCTESVARNWLRITNQICPSAWEVKEYNEIILVSCYHGFTFNHNLLSQAHSIDISLMLANHIPYIELKEQYDSIKKDV